MFIKRIILAACCVIVEMSLTAPVANACGGFFCTTAPINQAAEQIVFRQEGSQVTAMVRILYAGDAEDFSWVVPVPNTPEISIGANVTFDELDFASRPQFALETEGELCFKDEPAPQPAFSPETDESTDGGDGVTIEEELSVGPFDIDIVSSDNADDMSIWLQDNGYLLDDRGRELIEPYVLMNMKFVALKLKSGESSGSIQPLIMSYESEKPMIPIRLTAVAAEDDMGVLVWIVNDARAIPENYEHVTPNYTMLDWYSGTSNAYISYQSLITDAMDESGGQGFATDYAGSITEQISNRLTDESVIENNLAQLDAIGNDAEYLVNSLFTTIDPPGALASMQIILPLPDGLITNTYFDSAELSSIFTADELQQARIKVRASIVERELEPIADATKLLPQDAYMTRLYTTLSAAEMTLDPTFNYNANMPEQPLLRRAKLNASCDNEVSNWILTLGAGTGREGEEVLNVSGQPIPFTGSIPQPVNDQPAAFLRERTSADAAPELLFQAVSSTLEISANGDVEGGVMNVNGNGDNGNSDNGNGNIDSSSDGLLGSAGIFWVLSGVLMVFLRTGGMQVSSREEDS